MRSNYKMLGDYIELVSRTNSDLKYGIDDVRGCSNTKQIMQTRANLIGRTYEKFIVLKPQEFVFNRRTTRNGERIGMAFNNTEREYIFTNDYVAFRVKRDCLDTLLPEYLYLFFCRDEFDRYARYKSTGSATEFFNWEDMCAVPFTAPQIDLQKQIVKAYQTIIGRIDLKRKLNENLEATAQAILLGKINSNRIETTVDNLMDLFDYMRRPISSLDRSGMERIYPYYGAASLVDYVDNYIFDGVYGLLGEDGTVMDDEGHPIMQYVWGKFWVNNHAHVFQGKNGYSTEIVYLLLKNTVVRDAVTGAVQLKINQENLKKLPVIVPCNEDLTKLNALTENVFSYIRKNSTEINHLLNLKEMLLAKISDCLT